LKILLCCTSVCVLYSWLGWVGVVQYARRRGLAAIVVYLNCMLDFRQYHLFATPSLLQFHHRNMTVFTAAPAAPRRATYSAARVIFRTRPLSQWAFSTGDAIKGCECQTSTAVGYGHLNYTCKQVCLELGSNICMRIYSWK
jgi:hypothetical protein